MDFRAYYYTGAASLMKVEGAYRFKKSYKSLEELEDLYLYVRGSNESRGGSLFINRKNIDSPWSINPTWQDALGISESTDKDGNIKYS